MGELVVRPHQPIRFGLAVVVASMLIAIGTWLLLDRAHWSVIQGRLEASAEQQRLWNANRKLELANGQLREQLMAMERTASVDKQTESYLQTEIRDLQGEVFRLKGELAFFERIMESAGQAKGLGVQDIYIRRLAMANNYQLKLVLTNVSDRDAEASGLMNIAIEGRLNGESRLLPLKELSTDAVLDLNFKFRNFKRFNANMQLPAGFAPQRVQVELQPNDQKPSKITKTFDWPATAN